MSSAALSGDLLRRRWVQRGAAASLVAVLATSAAVSWGASTVGGRGARAAAQASQASAIFQEAETALARLEIDRHELVMEPTPQRRAEFAESRTEFARALAKAQVEGGASAETAAELWSDMARYDRLVNPRGGGGAFAAEVDEPALDAGVAVLVGRLHDVARQRRVEAVRAQGHLAETQRLVARVQASVLVLGVGLLGVLLAVLQSQRRHVEEVARRLAHHALHDALTGLPNRTLFAERLEAALEAAGRTARPCALLLLDLNRFKAVNDTFGHHYGDRLLAQVGPRLTGALREGDTVARLGGDEFAVVLDGVADEGEATAAAQRVRAALAPPMEVLDVLLDVEASIGVVVAPGAPPGASPAEVLDGACLLRRADVAMYHAKRHGLGVCVYSPDLDEARERLAGAHAVPSGANPC